MKNILCRCIFCKRQYNNILNQVTAKVKTQPEIILSANFKRDYVACFAIILFALIVIGEIVLAVSIPAYLGRSTAMAKEVRLIKLRESFDKVRSYSNSVKCVNDNAVLERNLVAWELNKLARFLRKNGDRLSSEDIARLQKAVDESGAILRHISNKKSFSRAIVLDTGGYVNSVMSK